MKTRPRPLKLRTDPLDRLPVAAQKHVAKRKRKEPPAGPADGGPAYPCVYGHPAGMTLRDYFAGTALSNLSATDLPAAIARGCYEIADAMLRERGA